MKDERFLSVWMGTLIVVAICFVGWLSTRGLSENMCHNLLSALGPLAGIVFASSKIRAQLLQSSGVDGGGATIIGGGSSLPPPSMPTKRPPTGLRRIFAGWALGGVATMILSLFLHGCAAAAPSADAAFAAEQLKCVQDARTRPEADQCRAESRVRWGLADGGDAGQ